MKTTAPTTHQPRQIIWPHLQTSGGCHWRAISLPGMVHLQPAIYRSVHDVHHVAKQNSRSGMLPREYEYEVRHFQSTLILTTTVDRIEQVVRERFVCLQSEKLKKKQSPGHALYAGDTASSGRGGSGRGGNSGRGRGGRGRGNAKFNQGGSNTFGARASDVRTAGSANDGSTAVTKPDEDTSKKYCTLCRKHRHWKSRCPGQVCATCKGNGHSRNVCPSWKQHAVVADFRTDLDPKELLEFDAFVAETGETSQIDDTAGKQIV